MFEKEVILVNKYGAFICKLEPDGAYWKIPKDMIEYMTEMLDIGDVFKIVENNTEI